MTNWAQFVGDAAVRRGHPNPDHYVNQIRLESANFNESIISCAISNGIVWGIAQLHPAYYPKACACDPSCAIELSLDTMLSNIKTYGSEAKALIAYNWGPGNMKNNWDGTWNDLPHETQTYLTIIMGKEAALAELGQAPVASGLALSAVLASARSRVGDLYVWGGKAPPSTDCSGFVSWCYQSRVPSFTDAIFDATERIEKPAPGDIVLYQYYDSEQPGVTYPHVALYLDDATVIDNRYGAGVGVHPQLARGSHARYYRRVAGVTVDTLGGPVTPPPPPVVVPPTDTERQFAIEIGRLNQALADCRNLVGNAYNADGEVRKALTNLTMNMVGKMGDELQKALNLYINRTIAEIDHVGDWLEENRPK